MSGNVIGLLVCFVVVVVAFLIGRRRHQYVRYGLVILCFGFFGSIYTVAAIVNTTSEKSTEAAPADFSHERDSQMTPKEAADLARNKVVRQMCQEAHPGFFEQDQAQSCVSGTSP
jgi:hypothetical protein